jgi:hypothetical protein
MITKTAIRERNERGLVLMLFAGVIMAGFLYALFLIQTTINIVERRNAEASISSLQSRVGQLEFEYITLRNNLSIEYAYELGYTDAPDAKFVLRGTDRVVSLDTVNN